MAISAAVGSPSINLIATTACPGSEPTMTAPASPPVESASASSDAPSPDTEIWGCAPSNPRVSRTSADDLTDPEPERHQRNPSSRPRA